MEQETESAGVGGAAEIPEDDLERREFMAKALSVMFGGTIVVIPAAAGVATLLSPLGRSGGGGLVVRLAGIEDLPADGTPKLYQVVAERTDAWTKYPKKPIGSVFLRKLPDGDVVAFNSSCPHAGCSVGFKSLEQGFHCPCHDSTFELDGSRGEVCVSPRGLDTLELDREKLAAGEIWVTFTNFKAGIEDKVELS